MPNIDRISYRLNLHSIQNDLRTRKGELAKGKRLINLEITSPFPSTWGWDHHIAAADIFLEEKLSYLKKLVQKYDVKLCCNYKSDYNQGRIYFPPQFLDSVAELKIPIQISIEKSSTHSTEGKRGITQANKLVKSVDFVARKWGMDPLARKRFGAYIERIKDLQLRKVSPTSIKNKKLAKLSSGSNKPVRHYREYFASLRIFGKIPNLSILSNKLSLCPDHMHRKGDLASFHIKGRKYQSSKKAKSDLWHLTAPVKANRPLSEHLDWFYRRLKNKSRYLKQLAHRYNVDVYCGYHSNCEGGNLELPHSVLRWLGQAGIVARISILVQE